MKSRLREKGREVERGSPEVCVNHCPMAAGLDASQMCREQRGSRSRRVGLTRWSSSLWPPAAQGC